MRRGVATYVALLALIFQISGPEMDAQPVSDSLLLQAPMYKEKLHLFTDRSIYAAGELVQFSLYNLSHPLLRESDWSTVVYMELFSPHQIPVAQGKYRLNSHGAEGHLLIPDSVSTGSYHLRVYTKWMRNFEASDYFHLPLYVVNHRKTQAADEAVQEARRWSTGESTLSSENLTCSMDKTKYGQREKVRLQIDLKRESFPGETYCVSIVKKGYLNTDYKNWHHREKGTALPGRTLLYSPETRGAYLTGVLSQAKDSTALPFFQVHITLLGPDSDYFGALTDRSGRIEIPIPDQSVANEVLITYGSTNGDDLNIDLQDEFSPDFEYPPPPYTKAFVPGNKLIHEMGVYKEIMKPFDTVKTEEIALEKEEKKHAFYGTPEFRYYTRDYIEIPNLEEFIFELIPQVKVVKLKRQSYFSIIDDAGPITEYAPLILVDFVPINQVEAILSLVPDQIEYIDVINAIYIRGSNNYGGIISIVTIEGDLAGLQIPEASSLYTFHPIQHPKGWSQQTSNPQKLNKRIPDLRTTLDWKARVNLKEESQNSIEFFTSDISGTFQAVIRGIDKEGELVQASCEFEVK